MAVFLGSLFLAFVGLSRLVFAIVDGRRRAGASKLAGRYPETWSLVLPPLVLLGVALALGLWTPDALREAWDGAVHQLGSRP
jgi:hydrogenase-4 component F